MAFLNELPYRPCVGILLLNKDGKVWIGQRRGEGAAKAAKANKEAPAYSWQMPQGGIDPGEAPFDAAVRELYEETNVRSVELIAEAPDWFAYDLPMESGKAWRGRYRGQTQKWFAFRFKGKESEIDIHNPAGGAHKPEFRDWRWERIDALPGLIVPFKRPVYEQVVTAFQHLAVPA
ncbi:RNA pyrophosphohydrolase [Hartmannibacter diazotrophicus]|uniref:RNA pyrophosphohydrolase n=1 Tax=Hartmannibacter diazotrophicus TaxID=1482074 RepID=A0A2C9DBI6_9HYPH|nr:RNA pyrophosphohydrolase [Hartmannibacter diazotrophicus]SON57530.1 RNA pyrophosphohydrolase [Hartmannibacter diazotrophicus]